LRQVLLNLLSNAVKFSDVGSVRIEVVREKHEEGRVVLRFTVTDTGIGIPASKQSIVFEAFRQADGSHTRKFGGTGLGLAICSRLVTLMGGGISVKSTVGKGSEFSFAVSFEVAPDIVAASPHGASRQIGRLAMALDGPPARSLRILLAEDNVINQK